MPSRGVVPFRQGGTAPWHMWGSTQNGSLTGLALVASEFRTPQLVRINYSRPETWTFLLWVQLLSATGDVPVAVNFDFIVSTGLGRTAITIDPFKRINFPLADTTAANINATKPFRVATQVEQAALIAADTEPNVIRYFPGQDIQVSANIASTGSINAGNVLRFQVGAWLAPKSHIRPEWFQDKDQFRGGENGGT